MAQYKVPQDVEADDKLLGPFTFRQLIYLFVAAGLIALAIALFQLFPLLVIIPVPFIIFFLALALPLRKDQPMETYLAALVSFYLKPNKRFWNPGQRNSTIVITAPKKNEGPRIRNISEDEAGRRLSFLADIIDSEGQSIGNNWSSSFNEEFQAEASTTQDMFESYNSPHLNSRLNEEAKMKHDEAIKQMRAAIDKVENVGNASDTPTISHGYNVPTGPSAFTATATQPLPTAPVIQPTPQIQPQPTSPASSTIVEPTIVPEPQEENPAKVAAMQQLATNKDYSVATIAKEAKRIKEEKDENEVYISLH